MYKQTTWSALMDKANQTNDSASKDFLWKCFQGYCYTMKLKPFDAETVMKWRNETVEIGIENMPKILSEVSENE